MSPWTAIAGTSQCAPLAWLSWHRDDVIGLSLIWAGIIYTHYVLCLLRSEHGV